MLSGLARWAWRQYAPSAPAGDAARAPRSPGPSRPRARRCPPCALALALVLACGLLEVGRLWRPSCDARGSATAALLGFRRRAKVAPPLPKPWKVGSWNQHRKSSYFQKDCAWVPKLLERGVSKPKMMLAIERSEVKYSSMEIQMWAIDYDIVGVQECDPLFESALGPGLRQFYAAGANDRDGRGIIVESRSAALLPPGVRELRREVATVMFRFRGGKTVLRNFLVLLLERDSDGQRLVFSSVHLHPPGQVALSRCPYAQYLEPLREAILAVSSHGSEGRALVTPVLLVGDFNMERDEFFELTAGDEVWQQFRPVPVEGGCTAHYTNPCENGDFALSSSGDWNGRALGSPDFGAYERFAEGYANEISRIVKLQDVETQLRAAVRSEEAEDIASLQEAKRELERGPRVQHRKGLLTSDHRPISFTGTLGDIR